MIKDQRPLLTASDAFHRIQPHFDWDQEEVHVIALNSRQGVINHRMLFRGTIDSCLIHPRELFRFLILSQASAFILFHNHPTGDPTPSPADIKITQRLLKLSKILEIKLLDHIVLTQGGFKSFKDLRLL
jgi:DNA repair protein RadC